MFTDLLERIYLEGIGYCHIGVYGTILALYPTVSAALEQKPVELTYNYNGALIENVPVVGVTIGVINELIRIWYEQQ